MTLEHINFLQLNHNSYHSQCLNDDQLGFQIHRRLGQPA